ncbi:hypothetical protein BECAL_03426 [Bellilinea caldifistulae]|jgi:hypothetical protein|uniref:Uncharacterized protein n=1 Tax=Bellilinea caldifistulae TaxID=360411 RepID=A0A0P6XN38_9CHLR|nr:hypothetical protein [Bellilinea caldifistulae]KPL76645.1 hypothetical protein AC812_04815 [Bellilinea caldifistulae]GAP12222.1 hypothetical protein BECAL_03426 [Bellilinea caldifistulae]
MKRVMYAVLLFVLLAVNIQPARADWGDFFDENGNLKAGVVDLGEQKVPADWMPDAPAWVPDWIYDGAATYHMYALPSGESVLLPSATTLFFMAMNPRESGLVNSDGSVGTGLGYAIWGVGDIVGGNMSGRDVIAAVLQVLNLPYARELADAIIQGKDAWSVLKESDAWNLFDILRRAANQDNNFYRVMLLYSSCQNSPTGCPQALLDELRRRGQCPPSLCPDGNIPGRTPTPDRVVQKCGAPSVTQGRISGTAVKTAPNYAIVTGQDPEKRGVDLQFSLTIEPTIFRYYTLEERKEVNKRCIAPNGSLVELPPPIKDNCKAPNRYVEEEEEVEYCVLHEQTFCEQARVLASASLKKSSRDWILNDLAQWYPGATLIRPDWNWRYATSQGCDASNTFRWTLVQEKVQIRDPGFYAMTLSGITSGTPVSQSRSFQIPAGEFDAYLMMTTIIK